MKRSEINRIMQETISFAKRQHFILPPFAFFTPEYWKTLGHEYDEIRDNKLGWDITDFGSCDFYQEGLVMFTLRSGACRKPQYFKRYAEKLMVARELQVTPLHMHNEYIEDIINRGGGNLCVQLYKGSPDGTRLDDDVQVSRDGCNTTAPAGTVLSLAPGESISFDVHTYHAFWGEGGFGDVLLIEIAMSTPLPDDSIFYEPKKRFPPIEEDEPPLYLLSSEYPEAPNP
jgi:D-lyxose ketol-isomerase